MADNPFPYVMTVDEAVDVSRLSPRQIWYHLERGEAIVLHEVLWEVQKEYKRRMR